MGASTLAHHMHRAWPGCLVFTASGGCGHTIRDYTWPSNTGSSTEFGVPAYLPLQRIRPPPGWSATHVIGVVAPEGSGGEDRRSRRAAVHYFLFLCQARRQWRRGDAPIAPLLFFPGVGPGGRESAVRQSRSASIAPSDKNYRHSFCPSRSSGQMGNTHLTGFIPWGPVGQEGKKKQQSGNAESVTERGCAWSISWDGECVCMEHLMGWCVCVKGTRWNPGTYRHKT